MKRFVVIISLLFLTVSVYAQDFYASYKMGGDSKTISIAEDRNGDINLYISIFGDEQSDNVKLILSGESNIVKFRESIAKLYDKFSEWRRVAIRNHVTDYRKEFGILFPDIEIGWFNGEDWKFDFDSELSFTFIAMKHTDGSVSRGAVANGDSLAYGDIDTVHWSMVFFDEDELETLLDKLDINRMKKKLKTISEIDDLFK